MLTLDMKKQRIRIFKQTLHELGDPGYIQLLINPEQKTIVIKACKKDAFLSHRMKVEKDCDCELYSTQLMHHLRLLDDHLEESVTYSAAGLIDDRRHLALFRLEDLNPVSPPSPPKTAEGAIA